MARRHPATTRPITRCGALPLSRPAPRSVASPRSSSHALEPDVASVAPAARAGSPLVAGTAAAPSVTANAPAPVGDFPTALGTEALTQSLLEVVSAKTGYPVDMLDLDMQVEADLGIDSIKRVEILGAMADRHPELPAFKLEELAELRTLTEVVAYIAARLPAAGPAAPAPRQALAATPAPPPTTARAGDIAIRAAQAGPGRTVEHDVPWGFVRLEPLSPPNFLEFSLPQDHCCLITDDGSPVTAKVAQSLAERGSRGQPPGGERPCGRRPR